MASSENITEDPMWVQKTPPNIPRSSMINLVNLLLRETNHRITVLERCDGPDPELYVVTRVNWRDKDVTKPVLPQLPRILSLLETLRGNKGVPREVYLDSTEGIAVYLPSGMKISELPSDAKKTVKLLMSIVEDSLEHLHSTMSEVESWFWKAARQKGFSPDIVEKMGNKDPHFSSTELMWRYQRILRKYFSLRFTIHRSEDILRVEE
ncbi:MAG: hypothetical protein E4H14_07830 [Candidatus Thorarchaeota archaeon]|nr:MAG: hypothetical protein E4H14_07830 [Candidatus Thorarchaeota archaeon]